MSISYYLVFFFLCLSLHACNAHARRLSAAIDDKKLEKTFQISNENEEKGNDKIPVLPKSKPSLSNEHGETRRDSINETSLGDKTADDQKLKDTKASLKISKDATDKTTSGANRVQTESLVSVSWRVPRNKRGDKHPGFNSDYSPPKTHPPSHN